MRLCIECRRRVAESAYDRCARCRQVWAICYTSVDDARHSIANASEAVLTDALTRIKHQQPHKKTLCKLIERGLRRLKRQEAK